MTRIVGTLNEDQCTFLVIHRSFLLRTGSVSGKIYREKQDTRFIFNSFLLENRAVYEIAWKNIVEPVGHIWKYGACALHAGYLRLQTYSQN
jgi:hypothetical protein